MLSAGDQEEREFEITLAEHPDNEGQAYLGVFTGGFFVQRFRGQEEPHWMRPLERFFERFQGRFPFGLDDAHRFEFEWRPDGHPELPLGLDLDFNLAPDLLQEAPCCTQDVTA